MVLALVDFLLLLVQLLLVARALLDWSTVLAGPAQAGRGVDPTRIAGPLRGGPCLMERIQRLAGDHPVGKDPHDRRDSSAHMFFPGSGWLPSIGATRYLDRLPT